MIFLFYPKTNQSPLYPNYSVEPKTALVFLYMARSLSLSFSLSKSRFTAATSSLLPSSNLVSFRSQSSDRWPSHGGDLYEIDTSASQSPSDPLIQKLEDAVHRVFVRRSAPDWLPFVPGASYWVPPPGSGSQTHGIAQLVAKLANPLTDEEALSTNSSHGWPSSDYFLKGLLFYWFLFCSIVLVLIKKCCNWYANLLIEFW